MGAVDTRTEILRWLLFEKQGLTIEELSRRLGITRSGVQQHMANLERDRLVREERRRNPGTGGRPSRVFILTEEGLEQFPRQYSLLSSKVLKTLKETAGQVALLSLLTAVAEGVHKENAHRVEGSDPVERIDKTVGLMNRLGYEAAVTPDGSGISAVNCVFHQLASEVREVCHFDVELISRLTGAAIRHTHCMVDGDHACVFKTDRTAANGSASTAAARDRVGSGGHTSPAAASRGSTP